MKRGSEKEREKEEYSNPSHSDIWEQSSYTDLTSSDSKLTEISILASCLIAATRFNTSYCLTPYDLVLWPILYKFIVLGSLDQDFI